MQSLLQKYIIVLCLLCFSVETLYAQYVTKNEAVQMAETFLGKSVVSQKTSIQSIQEFKSAQSIHPEMYLVNLEDGWVLVSGDKRIKPVLAYSKTGNISKDEEIPETILFLLDWYSDMIKEYRLTYKKSKINDRNIIKDADINPVVSPLLGSIYWMQRGNSDSINAVNRSYNFYCPNLDNCPHKALVGCGGVAIGQLLRYWKWPYMAVAKDIDSVSHIHKYEWDYMPSELTSSSYDYEAHQVAQLLLDCAVATNTDFGCEGSTMKTDKWEHALVNTFNYTSTLHSIFKHNYTDYKWDSILHEELENFRPVLYAGTRINPNTNVNEGHGWIIDGYDTSNKYHVIIGWGHSNWTGWYNLSTIGSSTNPYNMQQLAVIGIYPDNDCNTLYVNQNMEWTNPFVLIHGEPIVLDNTSINNKNGFIISGTSVEINSNVTISGDVTIAISNDNNIACYTPLDAMNNALLFPSLIKTNPHNKENNELPNNKNENIMYIFDIYGNLIYSGTETLNKFESLPSGIYINYSISDDSEIKANKIIR